MFGTTSSTAGVFSFSSGFNAISSSGNTKPSPAPHSTATASEQQPAKFCTPDVAQQLEEIESTPQQVVGMKNAPKLHYILV